jgi:hypothetical protein
MIEPAEGEEVNDSADDESQASTSTPPTLPRRQRLPVKELADRLQGGVRKYTMVHVTPCKKKKKRKERHREGVEVVLNANEK